MQLSAFFWYTEGLIARVIDTEKVHTTCFPTLQHTQLLEMARLTYAERTGTPAPASVWAILDKWTLDGGPSSTKQQCYSKPCWFEGDVHQSDKLFEELYLEAEMRLMAAFTCMAHRKFGMLVLGQFELLVMVQSWAHASCPHVV